MNKALVIGIGVLVIGLGIYGFTSNKKEAAMMEQKAMEEKTMMEKKAMEEKAMMEKKDGAMMEKRDGAMMEKKDGAMMEKDKMMMSDKGSYVAYAPEKLAMAKDGGKVVLFFHASWCPTCKALDSDIKARLNDIPGGVTILDVDYDNSAALKQKYGVTTQHTLVQVDASGNQLAKWSGGNTLATIVEKLK